MHSCIYEGTVRHCRHEPVTHAFQYRLFMVLLDLDEVATIVARDRLLSSRRHAACAYLPTDHLYDAACPLDEQIQALIREQTGKQATGPIRLLTQLRYFGIYFSPLNLFFVYDDADSRVEYVIAEVSNTPWNERHCYVLWEGNRDATANGAMQFSHPKEFHVSPFMDMDMTYHWQLSEPGETLRVRLANRHESGQLFQAEMVMRRRALSKQQLRRMVWRHPLMTARISVAIYYQALKLWWKKCPFYAHPKHRGSVDGTMARSKAEPTP